jgi:hypothetical protein
MGEIKKRILGNVNDTPDYDDWIIEYNADRKIHMHLKNIRMDLTVKTYNQFYDMVKQIYDDLELTEGLNFDRTSAYNWKSTYEIVDGKFVIDSVELNISQEEITNLPSTIS